VYFSALNGSSKQTPIIFLYSTAFVTEVLRVYCAIRNEYLKLIRNNFSFKLNNLISKKTFVILVVTEQRARAVESSCHIQKADLPVSNTDPDTGLT
jgi:hypothetical protein